MVVESDIENKHIHDHKQSHYEMIDKIVEFETERFFPPSLLIVPDYSLRPVYCATDGVVFNCLTVSRKKTRPSDVVQILYSITFSFT